MQGRIFKPGVATLTSELMSNANNTVDALMIAALKFLLSRERYKYSKQAMGYYFVSTIYLYSELSPKLLQAHEWAWLPYL